MQRGSFSFAMVMQILSHFSLKVSTAACTMVLASYAKILDLLIFALYLLHINLEITDPVSVPYVCNMSLPMLLEQVLLGYGLQQVMLFLEWITLDLDCQMACMATFQILTNLSMMLLSSMQLSKVAQFLKTIFLL